MIKLLHIVTSNFYYLIDLKKGCPEIEDKNI